MSTEFKAIVEWCVQSLEHEPEAWSYDGLYAAEHKATGVRVWMANSYYGMAIEFNGAKVGGVTFWSSFFGALTPWRRRLRHAVKSLPQAPRPDAERILAAIRVA